MPPCVGLAFHTPRDRKIWDDDVFEVLLFFKVDSTAVAVQRVMDYLVRHPELRLILVQSKDFNIGPLIKGLRENGVGANVCGYWGFYEGGHSKPFFRMSGMNAIVLGHAEAHQKAIPSDD